MAKKKPARLSLPAHQVGWMFDHAQEYFVEEIAKLEAETMRHERFVEQPLLGKSYDPDKRTRADRLKEIDRSIGIYRDVVRMIASSRRELGDHSAMDHRLEIHFKVAK